MSDTLKALLKVGFLTGSRAFGTERSNSDFDIVYTIDDSEAIDAILLGRIRKPSDYFAGYLVTDDDQKIINLIPVHPHDYLPWYLATLAMKETLKLSELATIQKYAVFMGMVSLFKGTVAIQPDLNGYTRVQKRIRADIKTRNKGEIL